MDEYKNNTTSNKSKLGKIIVVINLILLIPVAGILSYQFTYKELGKTNKAAKETLSTIETIESVKEKEQLVRDYDFVHQMSNNLIVAEDGKIRGYQEVTLENVELAIKMLEKDPFIVEELNKWKAGNFENVVEVHNYCWRILDGNEGKAIDVFKEGIDEAKKNIVKE